MLVVVAVTVAIVVAVVAVVVVFGNGIVVVMFVAVSERCVWKIRKRFFEIWGKTSVAEIGSGTFWGWSNLSLGFFVVRRKRLEAYRIYVLISPSNADCSLAVYTSQGRR